MTSNAYSMNGSDNGRWLLAYCELDTWEQILVKFESWHFSYASQSYVAFSFFHSYKNNVKWLNDIHLANLK